VPKALPPPPWAASGAARVDDGSPPEGVWCYDVRVSNVW